MPFESYGLTTVDDAGIPLSDDTRGVAIDRAAASITLSGDGNPMDKCRTRSGYHFATVARRVSKADDTFHCFLLSLVDTHVLKARIVCRLSDRLATSIL
jgi:hypothetical protein